MQAIPVALDATGRPADALDAFEVHLVCGAARGDTTLGRQPCPCEPAVPRWTGMDVSLLKGLCSVCGRGLVDGLTRWSWLGCRSCRDINDALGSRAGRSVLPLGRHSIMNGHRARLVDGPLTEEWLADAHVGWLSLQRWGRQQAQELAAQFPREPDSVSLRTWISTFPVSHAESVLAFEGLLGARLPPEAQPRLQRRAHPAAWTTDAALWVAVVRHERGRSGST